MRARHRLSKLLLRHGIVYSGGAAGTDKHDRWLRRDAFAQLSIQATRSAFDADYEAVFAVTARRDRLDAQIEQMAAASEFTPLVRRLGCLRGIATLTGFALAVEIGDWTRFTGASIGSFIGLVPSERSSGTSRAQGPITKTGNSHVRRLLIEAAWHQRARYLPSKRAYPRCPQRQFILIAARVRRLLQDLGDIRVLSLEDAKRRAEHRPDDARFEGHDRRAPAGGLDYRDLTEVIPRTQCAHRRVTVAYLRGAFRQDVERISGRSLADDGATSRYFRHLNQFREVAQLLRIQRLEQRYRRKLVGRRVLRAGVGCAHVVSIAWPVGSQQSDDI